MLRRGRLFLTFSPGLHDGVAAEFIAESRQDFIREGVGLTGAEALENGGGDNRGGDGQFDGLLHGPAALPRIFHISFQRGEMGILFESRFGQLEKPRTHDAPLVPEMGDFPEIQAFP